MMLQKDRNAYVSKYAPFFVAGVAVTVVLLVVALGAANSREVIKGEAISLTVPKLAISCSPLPVKLGANVSCELVLDRRPRSVSAVLLDVAQSGIDANVFLVKNITRIPKGYSPAFNSVSARFAIVTPEFGLQPTNLGTINLVAQRTGSTRIYVKRQQILDDEFNDIAVDVVPSAVITVS